MNSATIYFADQSSIVIEEDDFLIPVSLHSANVDDPFSSMGKPLEIYNRIEDGLIPAITTALCQCNFFYVNSNGNTIYSSSAVVRIVNN